MRTANRTTAATAVILLVSSLLLSGCGASYPNITEEENEIVSEYAVSLLLKYDSANHSRLVDTSEFMNSYLNAKWERENQIAEYEAAKALEEQTRIDETRAQEEALAGEESKTLTDDSLEKEKSDGTGGATVIDTTEGITSNLSVESVIGIEDFSINYNSYDLVSSYSSDDFFSMDATKGNKLLVVYFNVRNNGPDQILDVFNKDVSFKFDINERGPRSVFKSMLADDLGEYKGEFKSGETKTLVLLFEVPDDTTISDLKLIVSSPEKGSTTKTLLQ